MAVKKTNRSNKLSSLEAKYRKRREARAKKVAEPENAGRSIKGFVRLSAEVATSYTPSGYLKSAPIQK